MPNLLPHDPETGQLQGYSDDEKLEALELIADGMTPGELAEQRPDLPKWRTLRHYRANDPAFAEALARARNDQAEALIDRAIDSAGAATDRDSAAAARVQADTYLKAAALLDPARYAPRGGSSVASITINTNLGGDGRAADDGAYVITLDGGQSVQGAGNDGKDGGK